MTWLRRVCRRFEVMRVIKAWASCGDLDAVIGVMRCVLGGVNPLRDRVYLNIDVMRDGIDIELHTNNESLIRCLDGCDKRSYADALGIYCNDGAEMPFPEIPSMYFKVIISSPRARSLLPDVMEIMMAKLVGRSGRRVRIEGYVHHTKIPRLIEVLARLVNSRDEHRIAVMNDVGV